MLRTCALILAALAASTLDWSALAVAAAPAKALPNAKLVAVENSKHFML